MGGAAGFLGDFLAAVRLQTPRKLRLLVAVAITATLAASPSLPPCCCRTLAAAATRRKRLLHHQPSVFSGTFFSTMGFSVPTFFTGNLLILMGAIADMEGHAGFASRYWPQLAPILPFVLNSMITLLKPFIWLSDQIMKLFGGGHHEHDLRQEIKALTVLGRELNKLDEDEQRVIANILDLHDIKVRDIMTPRTVCETASPDEPLEEFAERVKVGQFSRYPVLDKDEAPLGIAFRYDMLDITDQKTVADLMKPVKVISDKMSAEQLMAQLIHERQHMCLVYDEYGTWLGLVTMEDVIETIIGQPIMDETDDIPNMRRFAKRRWEHKLKNLSED